MPGPVQPRVVGENLYARPDDEDHQKQIKKLLRTQPCGKGRRFPWADLATPRCCSTNTCTDDNPRKCCAAATARDQDGESDQEQPGQVEPLLLWPMRIRGAMPAAYGTEPAHVTGLTTSATGAKLCAGIFMPQ